MMARVLLIDDHPDLRDVVREMLEMNGHIVHCSVAAAEAEALLARTAEAFDVVIADYNLPGQNGLDFLRSLKSRCDCMTVLSSGDDRLESRATDAGIDDFWLKGADSFFDKVDALEASLAGRSTRSNA